MKVYLARHGEYISSGLKEAGSLSDKGRDDILQLTKLISKRQIAVSNIFHSGKRRAEQTAELFAKSFISANGVNIYAGINPEDDVSLFAEEMNNWVDDVLLVGHLPFMSRLVSQLVVNDENIEIVIFQPGTILCLERIKQDKWVINWMLSLDLL